MYVDPAVARAVIMILAIAIAMNVAVITAVLARLGGAHLAQAALKSGAAFGGTLALVLAVLTTMGIL